MIFKNSEIAFKLNWEIIFSILHFKMFNPEYMLSWFK